MNPVPPVTRIFLDFMQLFLLVLQPKERQEINSKQILINHIKGLLDRIFSNSFQLKRISENLYHMLFRLILIHYLEVHTFFHSELSLFHHIPKLLCLSLNRFSLFLMLGRCLHRDILRHTQAHQYSQLYGLPYYRLQFFPAVGSFSQLHIYGCFHQWQTCGYRYQLTPTHLSPILTIKQPQRWKAQFCKQFFTAKQGGKYDPQIGQLPLKIYYFSKGFELRKNFLLQKGQACTLPNENMKHCINHMTRIDEFNSKRTSPEYNNLSCESPK